MTNLINTDICFNILTNMSDTYSEKVYDLFTFDERASLDIADEIDYLINENRLLAILSVNLNTYLKQIPFNDISQSEFNKQIDKELLDGLFLATHNDIRKIIRKKFISEFFNQYEQY